MSKNQEHAGALAALAAGIIWGFLGPFVRGCEGIGITTVQMTCVRYIVVIAILAPLVWMRRGSVPRPTLPHVTLLIAMGTVGIAANSTFYFQSMTMIPLSASTVLQYLAPFIVVALSVPLFRERLSAAKALAVTLAFAGCVLCTGLMTDPGSMDLLGIAFGAISGFCFATYTLCSKGLARGGHQPTEVLFYSGIVCFLCLAPFCDLPGAMSHTFSSVGNLVLVVSLGILMTLLPFILFNYALDRIEAGKASVITFAEPLTATAIGFLMYGEALTAEAAVGMAMIMAGLIVVNRKEGESVARPRRPSGCTRSGS